MNEHRARSRAPDRAANPGLRRPCALGAALLGAVLALTGCGGDAGSGGSASARPVVTVWADDQRAAALKDFARTFGEKYGARVSVQAVSKDLQTNFVTASQAGEGPDVVVGANDWIGNLVQNGAIDPVRLSTSQRDSLEPRAVKAVTFNGQTYGMPYALENVALIRNTALVPDAPATIEEAVAVGQRLKGEGKVSEIMSVPVGQAGDAYHAYALYSQAGGYLFGRDAQGEYNPADLGLGTEASVRALEKFRALGEKGVGALKRTIGPDNAIPTFTTGKAPFLISGPWAVPDIKKAGIAYDIQAVPRFEGTGGKGGPFIGVQAFYVAAKAKNKALAQEFVAQAGGSERTAIALTEANPRPPALKAALAHFKDSNPDLGKFLAAGADGVIQPAIPQMNVVWDPFGKAEAAIIGGAPVRSTVVSLTRAVAGQIGLDPDKAVRFAGAPATTNHPAAGKD
ncbi:sugar ABC transporter substrate-binding protein [Streptomyces spiroverticillatus]|uniref:Sugar ABC transporter substrate-binding protein n=1 Tax=Streptomyces finlayi TaxID=67296 RepID=A0A918X013_9ACTN|nr:extracellular solute-binding protein [Streptomyces finlayi]GHA17030.1 sugar ABC transporter substrate-binding protein [Streptomyces spiroverticillatus]GHC99085.1 sugar ABC transporter substrate-binding protein [Streptomyces finlayi]